jgi:uncharacterized protein YndB with AHSA1/START domain
VKLSVAQVINRPVAQVFRFYAVDHVRNHPRWDPDIELWSTSSEPLGVGTIIGRRNVRGGTPVEGTMEVVEFEPNRWIALTTDEGGQRIYGRATFDELSDQHARLTLDVDMPGLDESMRDRVTVMVEGSLRRIKELIETESQPPDA